MAEIGCKKCTSPRCDGCNTFILETALRQGKFDALMNENRTVNIAANVRENVKGKWIEKWSGNGWSEWVDCTCSVCGTEFEKFDIKANFCPNCGCAMEEANEWS